MYLIRGIHHKMDVENNGASGALLKTECYICMEPCVTKSPCECKSHVHPSCLIKFLNTSGNTHCTICQGQYPVPPPNVSRVARKRTFFFIRFVGCIGLFFLFGLIGSCSIDDCQGYAPFSVNSLCSALSGYFIVMLLWVCSRERRRR